MQAGTVYWQKQSERREMSDNHIQPRSNRKCTEVLRMFGENLKTLRKHRGMSQEILAQQLNIVRQTVSKWEKGLSVPDAEMLSKIANLFEVSVDTLLGTKIENEKGTNEIASQLALLNSYLARRNRRSRIIWTSTLIALAATILIMLLCCLLLRI
jgi:putative transcriptional regulator